MATRTCIAVTVALIVGAPLKAPAQTPAPRDSYVGSAKCEPCHATQYARWRQAIHSRMTQVADASTVVGDFSRPVSLRVADATYRIGTRDGRYHISITRGKPQAGPPPRPAARGPGYGPSQVSFLDASPREPGAVRAEEYDVRYTLGWKRFQGYIAELPDGRLYVLPVFWQIAARRWIDWAEITPVTHDGTDRRQIWNVNCFNCHATGLRQNFNLQTRTFRTIWSEMAIGCEACHGPGGAHLQVTETWKPGTPVPAYPGGLKIFNFRDGDRRAFDTCAYCHGNKINIFVGFRPGDRYEDYAEPFLISTPSPANDPQGDYWPDGRPSRFNRPQALMQSECFRIGKAACFTCHEAHGSPNHASLRVPLEKSSALCQQCHTSFTAASLTAHTHHPANSAGSRCVSCHMSDVNWRLLIRRLDHTFDTPVPEVTTRYGVPNACNTCHDDRSAKWAGDVLDRWYGNGSRRRARLALADTFYAAGANEVSAVPGLEALVANRAQGAITRASAAEFLGRLGPAAPRPETVTALLQAAVDPEPVVRMKAARALGALGDSRAVPALIERTTDAARLVRVNSVAALLALGAAVPPAAAGNFARAESEYVEALRTFPDLPDGHTTLGWLYLNKGRTAEARQELDYAMALDSDALEPKVYLGVLFAREGELGRALALWREVRARNPRYPNIDRLINEAEARKRGH